MNHWGWTSMQQDAIRIGRMKGRRLVRAVTAFALVVCGVAAPAGAIADRTVVPGTLVAVASAVPITPSIATVDTSAAFRMAAGVLPTNTPVVNPAMMDDAFNPAARALRFGDGL